jgi:DNA (cytosine-5)-methyltransferase 1
MRCLELFAGAGGAALGLERAGLAHAALCEWDAHACATLRAAGLGPVVEGDVRDLDAIAAAVGPEPVDVLWSSFPCQAFSTAGARRGAHDERNGWPWTVAALDRFAPRWFLAENVRGLLLHRSGCTAAGGQHGLFGTAPAEDCPGCYFERVILPDLRRRFAHVGWWLLDAADFGVPQHRRRVIIWAGPVPLEAPRVTHGPRAGLPWVTMRAALSLPEGEVPMQSMSPGRWRRRENVPVHGPSPVVTSQIAKQPRSWLSVGMPYVGHLDKPAPTVSAVGECKGSGPGGHPERMQRASDALYLATGRRRLTVAECAILQDFPPAHPWQGPQTAQYRQAGNAVPPRLAEVVGRRVMEAEAATRPRS